MASSKQTGDYMEELICPVCLELLNYPVMLDCGHNFCKSCITMVWSRDKQPSCPECREECPTKKYTVNRLLANVIQRVNIQGQKAVVPDHWEKDGDQLCVEHKERLKLFCEEDEILACLLCVPEHRGHKFLTVQKAVSLYKDRLTTSLSRLQSYLKDHKAVKKQQEMKISEVSATARRLELHITSEFVKLHSFLQEKEEKLVQQLSEEETGILRQMEENLKKVNDDINAVQESISDIQHQLQQQDTVTFLKGISSFIEGLSEGQKRSSSHSVVAHTLNLGVYKGPLQYGVWKEMKSILNPGLSNLLLDSKTAHPMLVLSEDLTSVTCGRTRQYLPDNPERFDYHIIVLGSEGFTSGRHYWEVGVEKKTDWNVGVAAESINRKGGITETPKGRCWNVCLRNGNEYKVCDVPPKDLSPSSKPKRIGIYLDYEGGQVSFYNADNMSHLYTFLDTFTWRMYPYFSPHLNNAGKNTEPLKFFHLKL